MPELFLKNCIIKT